MNFIKIIICFICISFSFNSLGDVLLWSVVKDTNVFEKEFEQNYLGTLSSWLI